MKKKALFSFLIILLLALVTIQTLLTEKPVKESITYFPPDPETTFNRAKTTIKILTQEDEDEYMIEWETFSETTKKAYLRQDISLLYEDGILVDTLSKWEENVASLSMEKEIRSEDSGHYEAISYHYGEIHYPNDVIKSVQQTTFDQLYVIDSPLSPLESFKEPVSEEEKEWKSVLDHATKQQLQLVWKELIDFYSIPIENFYAIPLTELSKFNNQPLPGLTKEQTVKAIGGLWEGIYKNYFLGIEIEDGKVESPVGSTIPLILLNKSKPYLIVLFQSKEGTNIQLLQHINFSS
ncbi:hypothetical protein [Pseudalkalibacillus caeni]|uniref:Uncharacterized protein n=1 Tax=Exobacillus caeni TaxID=2574798 RepID=A0A5R9F0W1_9BACL|nr:hypothetical protein [Pseudalkalibacillus caeni]TLS36319.1 hypothetical protein FCL54_15415 [Pseudalkalibacillus caeni]